MESDLQHQHHPQTGSGLMRYQSAPSSYFSNFLDSDDFFPKRPLSPETERIFARFMNSNGGGDANNLDDFALNSPPPPPLPPPAPPAPEAANQQQQLMGLVKTETIHQNQPNNFNYQSASQPPRPSQPPMDFRVVNTAGLPPMKMEAGLGSSNLIRQRSSPAGLFSNINIQNELASYAAMRGMGNVGAGFGGSNNEAQFPTGSSGLRTIAESGIKPMGGATSPESGSGFNEGHNENYVTGFPIGSWDESVVMSNKVSGLKRARDDDGTEAQSGREAGSGRPPLLAHHLSLQKSSAEMAAIDNFFQFQDSIPCKIRAKRGCATHPRSIAERVRRTRISERMRKLQELVPNMDKQTNTSDMLDLAVDYIKDLQKEVQKLSDIRSKCACKQQS